MEFKHAAHGARSTGKRFIAAVTRSRAVIPVLRGRVLVRFRFFFIF